MSLKVETQNLKENGENIIELSKEYNSLIEELFEMIRKLQEKKVLLEDETEENSSTRLINEIMKEKSIYKDFGLEINEIGKILIDYQANLERIPKETIQDLQIESIECNPNEFKSSIMYNINEAKNFVESAKSCADKVNLEHDVGQNHAKNELREIINEINNYIDWLNKTSEKYNNVIEENRNRIAGTNIKNVNQRELLIK